MKRNYNSKKALTIDGLADDSCGYQAKIDNSPIKEVPNYIRHPNIILLNRILQMSRRRLN